MKAWRFGDGQPHRVLPAGGAHFVAVGSKAQMGVKCLSTVRRQPVERNCGANVTPGPDRVLETISSLQGGKLSPVTELG